MKDQRYWWVKVVAMVLALAGVVWIQFALNKDLPKAGELPLQPGESIPAKVRIGN